MSFRTQQQSSALAPIVLRLYAASFKDAADCQCSKPCKKQLRYVWHRHEGIPYFGALERRHFENCFSQRLWVLGPVFCSLCFTGRRPDDCNRSCAGMRAELILGALERSLGKRETGAQHQYLQQRLQYDAGGRLMDAEDRAVMMAWEG